MQIENCQLQSQKTTKSILTETTISEQSHKHLHYPDVQLDVHYKICQTFFEKIGKQFIFREYNLIQSSEELIRNLQQRINQKQLREQTNQGKDAVSKQNLERSLLQSECSLPRRSIKRVLSRTKLTPNTKNWFTLLNNSLIDIQQNCSRNTLTLFNNVLDENKKLADKLADIQMREAHIRKKKQYYQLLEKQILISKAKLKEVQSKLERFSNQIMNKNKLIEQQQKQYATLYKKIQVQDPTPRLKSCRSQTNLYLRQKQQLLKNKEKQLQQIDNQILQRLSNPFEKQCEKCCTLLKNWKNEMLKYKKYLQVQFEDMQKIYSYQKHQLAAPTKKYI